MRPITLWCSTLAMLVVLLAATVAWLEWTGWRCLRTPLEQRLSQGLHHPISLGDAFELHLLGRVALHLGLLQVDAPDWLPASPAHAGPILKADSADLVLTYGSLWHAWRAGRVDALRMARIELDGVRADLWRNEKGQANWSLAPDGQTTPEPEHVDAGGGLPQVDRLVLRQGQLLIDDAVLKLDADAKVSTSEGVGTGDGLRAQGTGHYLGHPFDVRLGASGLLPLLTQPHQAPPVPVLVHARAGASRLRFEGQIRDLLKLGGLQGKLALSGPSLAAVGDVVGVTLPTTAAFDLQGVLHKDSEVWVLAVNQLTVGESRLNGDFRFDRSVSPPLLQGRLTGPYLALADLMPAFGAATRGAPNPRPPSGKVLPQRRFDLPSLRAMDAHVAMHIQRAALGSWFAQPFEPLEADIQLKSGVLSISHVVARTAGGHFGGAVMIDGNGPQMKWLANVNWSDIRLENWLQTPAKPFMKPAQTHTPYVSGQLAGRTSLQGRGNSTAEWLASMNGSADVWVRDGQMSGLVAQALSLHVAEALGLWVTGDKPTPMLCAAASLRARNGQLTPEVAMVDTPISRILVSGGISLDDEKLGLMLISQPKSLSPLSLRTPVDVQGSFAQPHVSLHPRPLVLKVLAAAALSTVAPLAALVPLIDPAELPNRGCQQTLQALRPQLKRP